jgi:hypothetical protein
MGMSEGAVHRSAALAAADKNISRLEAAPTDRMQDTRCMIKDEMPNILVL